jgi:glycerate kinase
MKPKKIVLAPDSFKGTMTSGEVCAIMSQAVKRRFPGCETVKIPSADGGEGTADSLIESAGGRRVSLDVTGPLGEPTKAFYAVLGDGTAVIESAAAVGLPLVEGREDPLAASTRGVGELIAAAVKAGCRNFIVALGGTSTNDGGAGMAHALGAVFRAQDGSVITPCGGNLEKIASVDASKLRELVSGCSFTLMCDVDNPLCGPDGASAVFGPQKGASPEDVKILDAGLRHYAQIIARDTGADILTLPGGGAAGGLGAGGAAFLGGVLTPGIEAVLAAAHFDTALEGADMVLTGEGRIDGQSVHGKTVCGVARRAAKKGVPVIAVVGDIGPGADAVYDIGVSAIISINARAVPYEKARLTARGDLAFAVDSVMRMAALG